jgi:uncharacterized protein (TIGR03437 family)
MNSKGTCVFLFFLCSAAGLAADFVTGQAARLVIGQPAFTTESTASGGTIIGAATGLAYAADTLFVADSNRVGATPSNHRVLLFQNLSAVLPAPSAELEATSTCPICVGQASVVLGQPDFITTTETVAATPNGLRLPTAVASDGVHLAVADTNHNRVLIWNSIPTINDQPADVVVGQPDFAANSVTAGPPNARSMRGPQGVWIQNGRLYVADTDNNRILIYNRIPTVNGAAADLVLGQPNFTTAVQADLTQQASALATNLLSPVSVTSDGIRLYVTDLGYNRVLIWNSIPTVNAAPADLAVGQPDLLGAVANNAFTVDANGVQHPVLCATATGADKNGGPTYPALCNGTLNFPRFALSDGQRLFIADGGNDRVLVFNQVPTQSGQAADFVIGQTSGSVDQASDDADSLTTPTSLAWDGVNLYVSDTYNRRILAYSIGQNAIPFAGIRNAASIDIFAVGSIALSGTITAGDSVTVTICGPPAADANTTGCISPAASNASSSGQTIGTDYTYKVQKDDTFDQVVDSLVNAINTGAGDPNVVAAPDPSTQTVLLAARQVGEAGNNVAYTATVSTNATVSAAGAGGTLSHGGDAAKVAPGSLVSLFGVNLSADTAAADASQDQLPTTLAGTEVYFNGIRAPLLYVSPTQINTQIPWEVADSTSINAYVRSIRNGGIVMTTPVAVSIVTQNPGIFARSRPATGPGEGVVLHGSSQATGVILVDGTIQAGDVVTITIEDRSYTYTVLSGDNLDSVRDALVALVNTDPKVSAIAGIAFARNLIIRARLAGPEGNGTPYSVSVTGAAGSSGANLILTPEGSSLCCANIANAPVTPDNPAIPGEVILVYATGLGAPQQDETISSLINTGAKYPDGGPVTQPVNFVSSLAGNKTANVLSAGLKPGTVGVYEVVLQLNSDMPSDPLTQLYIAQDVYVSNIVTFAVTNPADSNAPTPAIPTAAPAATPPAAQNPQPTVAAVANAASYYAAAITPGENIVIFGSGLGPGVLASGSSGGQGNLPTVLAGTQVLFDGIPAPVVYAMANQTSVMVPYEIAGKPTTSMQVLYNGAASNVVSCSVVAQEPGIYTLNSQGFGQAAILNQDGVTVNGAASPAPPGSIVSVYLTGAGVTKPVSVTGSVTPTDGSGLPQPVGSVSATVGGIPASIEYAGAAPGAVSGIAQVNLRIPINAPSGPAVPIAISIGPSSTQTGVTLAVQ